MTAAELAADPRQANATYRQRDERRLNRVARLGLAARHGEERPLLRLHAHGDVHRDLQLGMIRPLLSPDVPVRFVENPVREIHRMATMMPKQVVDPRPRLPVHVQVRAAEEIGLDDHVMQVEGAFLDALADLAMRARKAAGVRHHADLAGRFRRLHHVLGVSEAERHRDLDLDVLAHGERQERLVRMLIGGCRQNDGINSRTIDAGLQVSGGEGNIPLRGEILHAFFGAASDRDDLYIVDLCQRLHMDFAHRTSAC